jgi:hypothetical protein
MKKTKKGKKNMKKAKTKVLTAITLVLLLTITAFVVILQTVQAQGPGTKLPTWLLLSAAPSPVGVGQTVYLNAFLSKPTATASGRFGDYFEGITIEMEKPDGTRVTLGPYTGDPTGGIWTQFFPDQIGTYTLQAFYAGQILTGDSLAYPGETTRYGSRLQYIGTEMLPSESEEVLLEVQEEQVTSQYQTPPLPTEYWSRPIYATNYNWAELGGNWLGLRRTGFAVSGIYDAMGSVMPYTTSPNTGHILWTKPTAFGGQVGGPIDADQESQYMSTSIATMSFEPIIIHGILYYVHYPEHVGHRASWIAVDLRTGEELWNKPCGITDNEFLRCGQVIDFHSIQEYGSNAYLWSIEGTSESIFGPSGNLTLRLYDPMTCTYICEIVNGTQNLAMIADIDCNEQGTLLGWQTSGDQLYLWNSTRAIAYPNGFNPASGHQRTYRPSGSIQWSAGIEWSVPRNFTLAGVPTGNLGIGARTPEVILLRSAPEAYYRYEAGYQVTVGIDAKTGNKLWGPLNQTIPEAKEKDVSLIAARDGVYVLHSKDTNEAWGYSLENGELLWGPIAIPGNAWSSISRTGQIAYGNFYKWDFGGYCNAFDLETGELQWTFTRGSAGYDAPYGIYPLWTYQQSFVDGKIFLAEGSLYNPPLHPSKILAIDAITGELVWDMLFYGSRMCAAHADGMMVMWNSFDKQIYTFGKGPTETTVTASPKVTANGGSVLLEGNVMDISSGSKQSGVVERFPKGLPTASDGTMTEWMEYVYMQQPMPTEFIGVTVKLETLDPNNNFYEIGTVTTDGAGMFKILWEPPVPGEYTIYASFAGSESYWPSFAETAIGITEAPAPSIPIEPDEPTEPEEPVAPMISTEVAVIAAVAVVALIGVVAYWILRKRQ